MFLKERELILCAIRGSALIFVDDIDKWRENFKLEVYPNRIDEEYKQVPIIVESIGISEIDCYCDFYNGDRKPVLKNDLNGRYLYLGDNISDLHNFLEALNCEYKIFMPFEDISNGESKIDREDLKLCYIDGNSAFFTNNPNQRGDGWDKLGYEEICGNPEIEDGYELSEIKYYALDIYLEPYEFFHGVDLSVEQINKHITPWLIPTDLKYEPIFEGESLSRFVSKIKDMNGSIFLELRK